MKQRIVNQAADVNLSRKWNEVVIDNRLLIPRVREHPTTTILAFVCVPSESSHACVHATTMRDAFHKTYGVTGRGVPVVAIDTTLDVTASGGPFVLPPNGNGIVV